MRGETETGRADTPAADDLFDGDQHPMQGFGILSEDFEKNPAAQGRSGIGGAGGKPGKDIADGAGAGGQGFLYPRRHGRREALSGDLPLDPDDMADPVDKGRPAGASRRPPGPQGEMGQFEMGMGIDQRRQQNRLAEIDRFGAGGKRP